MDPKVEWIFPGKINLSSQQLEQLNYEISADQVTSLNEYFFRQDGYVPLVHLRLVLKNINPQASNYRWQHSSLRELPTSTARCPD